MSAQQQPSILTVCLADMATELLSAPRPRLVRSVASCGASAADRFEIQDSSRNAERYFRGGSRISPRISLNEDDLARGGIRGVAGRVEGTTEGAAGFLHADSAGKAIELLRLLHFDLLVTGDALPDMSVEQLIKRVRTAWPWQKWAIVASDMTPDQEIIARSLGASAVFDAPPDWRVLAQMAEAISRKTTMTAVFAGSAAEPGGSTTKSFDVRGDPSVSQMRPSDRRMSSARGAPLASNSTHRPKRSAG